MPTTLVITNDFPPAIGGIEAFVAQVCELLGDVVVLTREHPDAAASDHALSYPVHRQGRILLPTAGTLRAARELMVRYRADRIVFGAAAPLGLLAPALRQAGACRLLAISHGHETWWARLPGSRQALRRIGDHVDAVSFISEFTRGVIAPALSPAAQAAMVRLAPPVGTTRFRPRPDEVPSRPTVIAAGRLIAQKGFDTLLAAWDLVLATWRPGDELPELVLIGDGPHRAKLQARADRLTQRDTVRFLGAVPHSAMPALLARGHVFALPVRTRLGGLNPEGLGMVFAEAAACGLAVVAGDSGGTRDTLVPGTSGLLTPPDDPGALAAVLLELLTDLPRARAMGVAGRAHVRRRFSPEIALRTLEQALDFPT